MADHHILELLHIYGYWLMAFGALIEGETFLLVGGIAASQGLLHLPGLILLAVIGSTFHDHVFYALGYFGGRKAVHKFKSLEAKSEKVLKMVDQYGIGLILILRFLYGFRTIIPVMIGISPISYLKFLIFDVIGGIIWATFFIMGGYFFGKAMEELYHRIEYYEDWLWSFLVLAVILIISVGLVWFFVRKRRAARSDSGPDSCHKRCRQS